MVPGTLEMLGGRQGCQPFSAEEWLLRGFLLLVGHRETVASDGQSDPLGGAPRPGCQGCPLALGLPWRWPSEEEVGCWEGSRRQKGWGACMFGELDGGCWPEGKAHAWAQL